MITSETIQFSHNEFIIGDVERIALKAYRLSDMYESKHGGAYVREGYIIQRLKWKKPSAHLCVNLLMLHS